MNRILKMDWFLLLIPGVIWGTSFLFIAEALEAIGPNGVTFVRILIGFTTLALFPASWRSVSRRDWGAIALLGVVWMAFPLSMFPHAEQRVSSAVTGMLNGTGPLLVAIVTSSLSRRLPSRGVATGLIVGVIGTVLVALPTIHEGRSSTIGVALILIAMLSYAFALSIAQPLQHRYGALPVIWRAQAVALILTAPLGAPELLAAQWTPIPLLSIIALGALGTGIAFVVMATAAGRVGPTRASATVFLIPGVALLLGVLVRGERVALLSVIGCVVCVAGAWVMRTWVTSDTSSNSDPSFLVAKGQQSYQNTEIKSFFDGTSLDQGQQFSVQPESFQEGNIREEKPDPARSLFVRNHHRRRGAASG